MKNNIDALADLKKLVTITVVPAQAGIHTMHRNLISWIINLQT